jgi:HSP20 family protein
MAIVRWAPFDLADEPFGDLVRRTFGDFGSSLLADRATQWSPALDAFIEGEQLHVRLELPGIDPAKDVDIEVENGVLHVRGERKQESTGEGNGWFRREMSYGSFERRIGLPEGVDAENVQASYDAGILDITIPLPAKVKSKVKVSVGNGAQQLDGGDAGPSTN